MNNQQSILTTPLRQSTKMQSLARLTKFSNCFILGLVSSMVFCSAAQAGGGFSAPPPGSASYGQGNATEYMENQRAGNQDDKALSQAEAGSKGPAGAQAQPPTPVSTPVQHANPPVTTITVESYDNIAADSIAKEMKQQVSFGAGPQPIETAAEAQAITTAQTNTLVNALTNGDRWVGAATAAGSAMATGAANGMAGAAVSQSMGAINFSRYYLTNFTAMSSTWVTLRNSIFMPMAILLLLPGAVLAQVKAIVAQGSPILGEVSPFEGITRSIVAIFLIPASFLVVNYGIDLSNAITYGISNEYTNLFGTDMYMDAECAEMRAFPSNSPGENLNALLPTVAVPIVPMINNAWSQFESFGIANKLFDPCVGLNQSAIPDEASSATMTADRMMANGGNAFLTMTWNMMCAFQTVFIYYLWFMGPIVAALWVWPIEKLRSALPSWIEGTVTICFWSLFWNVVILLMACFRGVSETGTVIMTALNGLATISVWYAFDFSELISQGAAYSMQNAMTQAMSKAAGGGRGGGGGGGQQSGGGGGSSLATDPSTGRAGFMTSSSPSGGSRSSMPSGFGSASTSPSSQSSNSLASFSTPMAGPTQANLGTGPGGVIGGGATASTAAQSRAGTEMATQVARAEAQAKQQTQETANRMTAYAQQEAEKKRDVTAYDFMNQQKAGSAAALQQLLTQQNPDLARLAGQPLSNLLDSKNLDPNKQDKLNTLASTMNMALGVPALSTGPSLAMGSTPPPMPGISGAGNPLPPPGSMNNVVVTDGSTPPPNSNITRVMGSKPEDSILLSGLSRSTVPDVPAPTASRYDNPAVDFNLQNSGVARDMVLPNITPVYTNPETITQINQQQPAPTEQIQYIPVTREVIHQEPLAPQQPPTPKPATPPPMQFSSAPSIVPIPGRNIADIVSGMKPGIKPNSSQDPSSPNFDGTSSSIAGQQESLSDQLARLQRGGGRPTAKGKDTISGLPPQESPKSDDSDKPENTENPDESDKKNT